MPIRFQSSSARVVSVFALLLLNASCDRSADSPTDAGVSDVGVARGALWFDGGLPANFDVSQCPDGTNVIVGTNENDVLNGTEDADCIFGLQGDDIINGFDGDDILIGGAGNDSIYGGAGEDILIGNQGNDTLIGGGDRDWIDGGAGVDGVFGGAGNDTIYGGNGVDDLHGGDGDDWIHGQVGNDFIYGDAGNDELHGGDGRDTIEGGDGDDFIYGEQDDDELHGGDGDDAIEGGVGIDVIFGDGGNDEIRGGSGDDTIDGGSGNDEIYGEGGSDTIYGNTGDDRLYGGADVDYLRGGAGNDILWGGSANDWLYGDEGNDVLSGAAGTDTLRGGAGDDVLVDVGVFETLSGDDGTDSCVRGCELPTPPTCGSDLDCGFGQSCMLDVCLYCVTDTQCDDRNPTTEDTCFALSGCTHVCENGAPTAELCDSLDNDCDGRIDEGFSEEDRSEEICDGIDNDCNGTVDDPEIVTRACPCSTGTIDCVDGQEVDECTGGLPILHYYDGDADGRGDPLNSRGICAAAPPDPQWVLDDSDCDDECDVCWTAADDVCDQRDNDCDQTIDEDHVRSDETCDGLDNDCDARTDEGLDDVACTCSTTTDLARCENGVWHEPEGCFPTERHPDADGDGRGDQNVVALQCSNVLGWVDNEDDCNDACATCWEGAFDTCDGIDNDCDGSLDEAFGGSSVTCGVGPCTANGTRLCVNGTVQNVCTPGTPAASDACDGIDNDCDGELDEDVSAEVCDGIDNDCDGVIDNPALFSRQCPCSTGEQSCTDGVMVYCQGGEPITYHRDRDGDGRGDPLAELSVCAGGDTTGWVRDATDCDDDCDVCWQGALDACDQRDNDCDGRVDETHTPSAEVCDGEDSDCDGVVDEFIDEACPCGTGTVQCVDGAYVSDPGCWRVAAFRDSDGDGFGSATGFGTVCPGSSGWAQESGDCNDACPTCFPGATETCDAFDNDCDGAIDEGDVCVVNEPYVGAPCVGDEECISDTIPTGYCLAEEGNGMSGGICVADCHEVECPGASACVRIGPEAICVPTCELDGSCRRPNGECTLGLIGDSEDPRPFTYCLPFCYEDSDCSGGRRCDRGFCRDSVGECNPASQDAECDGYDGNCNGSDDEDFGGVAACASDSCGGTSQLTCVARGVVSACDVTSPGCDAPPSFTPCRRDEHCQPLGIDWVCATEQQGFYGGRCVQVCDSTTVCAAGTACLANRCVAPCDENGACATPGDACLTNEFDRTRQCVPFCVDDSQCVNGCNPQSHLCECTSEGTVCDWRDNDCDGESDEGLGECPIEPERCDAIDNDADGTVDEDTDGTGLCRPLACPTSGSTACTNGLAECAAGPGCETSCDNGADDDGDGDVDCNDSDCALEVACGYVGAGGPCVSDEDCSALGSGAVCYSEAQTRIPGGYCSRSCASDEDCGLPGTCQEGLCFGACLADGSCNDPSSTCVPTGGASVCFPQCSRDSDCRSGICEQTTGRCDCANEEIECNGYDDDCDGTVDEGLPSSCEGTACASFTACVNGRQVSCESSAYAFDIVCNGIDEDCDGDVDEDFPRAPVSCGACGETGFATCSGGVAGSTCPQPSCSEVCGNDVDDDGDGLVDCADTACTRDPQCVANSIVGAECQVDADCPELPYDGTGPWGEQSCMLGWVHTGDQRYEQRGVCRIFCGGGGACLDGSTCVNGVCQRACDTNDECGDSDLVCQMQFNGPERVAVCSPRWVTSCSDPTQPCPAPTVPCAGPNCFGCGLETCNGTDDDCDTRVDEGLFVPSCAGLQCLGIKACSGGVETDCSEPLGDDATCDGLDDDCDSRIDEDFEGTTLSCPCGGTSPTRCVGGTVRNTCAETCVEDCFNGVDDDANGRADCEDDACVHEPQCVTDSIVGRPCWWNESCPVYTQQVPGMGEVSSTPYCYGGEDTPYSTGLTAIGYCLYSCDPVAGVHCPGGSICADGTCVRACDTNGGCGEPDRNLQLSGYNVHACESYPIAAGSVDACVPSCEVGDRCWGNSIRYTCLPTEPAPPLNLRQGGCRECAHDDDTCDGIDDDCDGLVDEDWGSYSPTRELTTYTCGTGECVGTGTRICDAGEMVDLGCIPPAPLTTEDPQNGFDDNCNGTIDESGGACMVDSDCPINGTVCVNNPAAVGDEGICVWASCANGVLDAWEEKVDCGGICPLECADHCPVRCVNSRRPPMVYRTIPLAQARPLILWAQTTTYISRNGVLTKHTDPYRLRYEEVNGVRAALLEGRGVNWLGQSDTMHPHNDHWYGNPDFVPSGSVPLGTLGGPSRLGPDGMTPVPLLSIPAGGIAPTHQDGFGGTFSVWQAALGDSATTRMGGLDWTPFTTDQWLTIYRDTFVTHDWQRFSATMTPTDDTHLATFAHHATLAPDGSPLPALDASQFYAFGFQVEERRFPTSYIPTTNGPLTRGEDRWSFRDFDVSLGQNAHYEFDVYPQFGSDDMEEGEEHVLLANSNGVRLVLRRVDASTTALTFFGSVYRDGALHSELVSEVATSWGRDERLLVTWSATAVGVRVGAGPYLRGELGESQSTVPGMRIGADLDGSNPAFVRMSDLRIPEGTSLEGVFCHAADFNTDCTAECPCPAEGRCTRDDQCLGKCDPTGYCTDCVNPGPCEACSGRTKYPVVNGSCTVDIQGTPRPGVCQRVSPSASICNVCAVSNTCGDCGVCDPETGGCSLQPENTSCQNGEGVCTVEGVCNTCREEDCPDPNECTRGSCGLNMCVYQPLTGAACSEGTCVAGECDPCNGECGSEQVCGSDGECVPSYDKVWNDVFKDNCTVCHGAAVEPHFLALTRIPHASLDVAAAHSACDGLNKARCTLVRVQRGDMPDRTGCGAYSGTGTYPNTGREECLSLGEYDTLAAWAAGGAPH